MAILLECLRKEWEGMLSRMCLRKTPPCTRICNAGLEGGGGGGDGGGGVALAAQSAEMDGGMWRSASMSHDLVPVSGGSVCCVGGEAGAKKHKTAASQISWPSPCLNSHGRRGTPDLLRKTQREDPRHTEAGAGEQALRFKRGGCETLAVGTRQPIRCSE